MRSKRMVGSRRWTSLATTLAAFAVLGATLAWWGLELFSPGSPIAPSAAPADQRDAADLGAASRLFGNVPTGPAATAPVNANIQVIGVAAAGARASAVLAIDSTRPKAYLVGETLAAGTRLLEVRADRVVVERNGARIELPAPARPSVAILSAGPARAGAGSEAAAPTGAHAAAAAVASPTPAPAPAAAPPPAPPDQEE